MNERLKELAEKSGMSHTLGCFWQCGDHELERFADLVRDDEREWVGLTSEELATIVVEHAGFPTKQAQAISDKLKEKNTT